jgi:hypothetical protein
MQAVVFGFYCFYILAFIHNAGKKAALVYDNLGSYSHRMNTHTTSVGGGK